MKTRAYLMGLLASVAMTSGCCNNPCWGWRLHPFQHPCGCCPASAPVVAPIGAPVAFRIPTAGPDCPSCGCGGGAIAEPTIYPGPMPGYPAPAYPPVIGSPVPLPGGPVGSGSVRDLVPSPMPNVAPAKN
jgi:hypothetical protein